MPKAQHSPAYKMLPFLLKNLRESAGMTQRDLGKKLKKPQSWIYNCESANRRVDVTEFAFWCRACGVDPVKAFGEVLGKLR
jgi:transcriptional regulator with XRE-family HTH domain